MNKHSPDKLRTDCDPLQFNGHFDFLPGRQRANGQAHPAYPRCTPLGPKHRLIVCYFRISTVDISPNRSAASPNPVYVCVCVYALPVGPFPLDLARLHRRERPVRYSIDFWPLNNDADAAPVVAAV